MLVLFRSRAIRWRALGRTAAWSIALLGSGRMADVYDDSAGVVLNLIWLVVVLAFARISSERRHVLVACVIVILIFAATPEARAIGTLQLAVTALIALVCAAYAEIGRAHV